MAEFGTRKFMLGLVIQMWTMLIATLESVRIFLLIRERSPWGPPRARHAFFVITPHRVDYVGCACISSSEEEGEPCKDASRVKMVIK